MTPELREYQSRALDELRENIRRKVMNQILCAPTGAGKTLIGSHMADEARKKGKRVLFVVDRISLLDQTSEVFDSYGIDHGVIQSKHWRFRPYLPVQVCSQQTLARREWPEADLIIVDEAHTVTETVRKRIERRDVVTIGLTATPFTRGLGKLYDGLVNVTTTNELIAQGFLSPYRIFAASSPNMEGVRVVAGEWDEKQTSERAMEVVGDCVVEYLKHGNGKKFICSAVDTAHVEELHRQFVAAGVICAAYTYKVNDDERAEIIKEFRKPDSYIRGLITVTAASKGFDVPDIGVVIMARPLRKSLAEHIQFFGRGLRAHPGKEECIVLDHSGNSERLWHQWNEFFANGIDKLDDGKKREKPKSIEKDQADELMKCPQCKHLHKRRPFCPACFPAGTLVLTEHGWTPIEEVKIGTLVLTHKGRWRAVINTIRRTEPVIELRGLGHPCIATTADHLFLTRSGWEPAGTTPEWATPAFIERFPVPSAPFDLTPALCRLIGCFLGDGFTSIRFRSRQPKQEEATLVITCGHTEEEVRRVQETISGAGFHYNLERIRTGHRLTIYAAGFTRWLRAHFGVYSHGKRLPSWVYGLSHESRAALLRGYLEADGHISKRDEWHSSSVSKALTLGIKLLAQSLGHGCRMYMQRGGPMKIEGRPCVAKDKWRLVGKPLTSSRKTQVELDGLHHFAPIKARRLRSESETVFDLTVEEDHSYVVEGIVVHNCGHQYPRREAVKHVAGTLKELIASGNRRALTADLWPQIAGYARERRGDGEAGRKMALALYKSMTGEWPLRSFESTPSAPLTPEVSNRIRAANIRWARSKARQERRAA